MYWNIKKVMSYNCLFNFIVGSRGVGKTFGAKQQAIDDFIKKGEQFVYVRRYKEELKKIDKFFDDIREFYPDHELTIKKPNFYIDGKICGCCVALSTAKIEKSTPFPKVTKIIFDEFILDKGVHHYLPDEVTNFLELYSTIARSRDVFVYFLSNALTVTNPYFLYFNITLPYKKEIKADGDILIQLVQDSEYTNKMKNTRFGKIIEGTPYSDYAIENTFLRDNKNFVEKKTERSQYYFTMIYRGNKFGVWIDRTQGLIFVSNDIDNSCKLVYSTTMDDHTPNRMLLKRRSSPIFTNFIDLYKLGSVRFETVNIKNICNDIIKMTL